MKLFPQLLILSLSSLFFYQAGHAQSEAADIAAIKKAIQLETMGFFKCDLKGWSEAVLEADYFVFAVTDFSKPGSVGYAKGKDFYQYAKDAIGSSDCQPYDIQIEMSEWNIQIRDKVAWAAYKETATMPDKTILEARTLKILEKIDGKWKIAAISSVWDFNGASKPWKPNG